MKQAWTDVETGGLDAVENGLLQVAIIIGKDKFVEYIKPPTSLLIEDEALAVNGITRERIAKFTPEAEVFKNLLKFLDRHVDRFDKTDKLQFNGYNSNFDAGFIQELFKRNGNNYYGAYFSYYDVDTFALVKILLAEGRIQKGENLKLGTMCKQFGIIIENEHDAFDDIKATKKLHKKLVKKYFKKAK